MFYSYNTCKNQNLKKLLKNCCTSLIIWSLITINEIFNCGESQLCTHNQSLDIVVLNFNDDCIFWSIALMHVKIKISKTALKLLYIIDYLLFNHYK